MSFHQEIAMNKLNLIIPILLIALVFVAGCTQPTQTTNNDNTNGDIETKTFVITGENFKFVMNGQEAPELRVKQGDTVRIEFSSIDGFHDWVVDEFGAATERVNTGGSTSVEFVADKKGTFEYYCSVGEHRAMGMKGNLVVE